MISGAGVIEMSRTTDGRAQRPMAVFGLGTRNPNWPGNRTAS